MKRILSLPLLMIISISLSAQTRKYAMIAVTGETLVKGYDKLETGNDTVAFCDAMSGKGFSCTVLKNANARISAICQYLNGLITKVHAGDDVVLAFRMHGDTIKDSGVLDEKDGYDEILIAYDGYLSDDTLNYYLTKLKTKVGQLGSVLFIVDACHSGTMAKGFKDEFNPVQLVESPKFNNLTCFYSTLSFRPQSAGSFEENLITRFSAAYKQVNQQTTFQGLFDKIRFDLKQEQYGNPYAEGDLDRFIISKKPAHIPPHFVVLQKIMPDSNVFSINASLFDGVKAGMKVTIYPPDTYDFINTPKTESKIGTIGYTESEVWLPLTDSNLVRGAWVILDTTLKRFDPVNIHFEGWSETEKARVKKALSTLYKITETATAPGLVLGADKSKNTVYLRETPGNPYFDFTWKNGTTTVDSLLFQVARYMRAKFLIRLNTPSTKDSTKIRYFNLGATTEKKVFKDQDKVRMYLSKKGENAKVAFLEITPRYDISFLGVYSPSLSDYNYSTITAPAGRWYIKLITGPWLDQIAVNFEESRRVRSIPAKAAKFQVQTFSYEVIK